MDTLKIYQKLLNYFGRQHWWPGKTKFEIAIGAILTQQTSWKQVEKAINNLKENNLLNAKNLAKTNVKKVETLVRPSGFYKQKAKHIINFAKYLVKNYNGRIEKFLAKDLGELRKEFLSLDGIGKETADSIILYAANKPIFPIDAYTIRIFNRLDSINIRTYDEMQKMFHDNLQQDTQLFNEFHALIVRLGKTFCKTKPVCSECPLIKECKYNKLSSR